MRRETFKVLICEDDDLNLGLNQRCVEIISQREEKEVTIYSFQDVTEEMEYLIEHDQIEIAILDIELASGNGIDIARQLQAKNPRIPILFITSHEEYKALACDIMAIGFIEKPIHLEKFDILYSRALSLVECEKKKTFRELVDVVVDKRHIQLRLASIICVEKVLRKVEFHTSKGMFMVNGTLNDIGERLGAGFIKISQSVIVNRDKILSVDSTTVYLTNGEEHTIGRTYIKQVRDSCKFHLIG